MFASRWQVSHFLARSIASIFSVDQKKPFLLILKLIERPEQCVPHTTGGLGVSLTCLAASIFSTSMAMLFSMLRRRSILKHSLAADVSPMVEIGGKPGGGLSPTAIRSIIGDQ